MPLCRALGNDGNVEGDGARDIVSVGMWELDLYCGVMFNIESCAKMLMVENWNVTYFVV